MGNCNKIVKMFCVLRVPFLRVPSEPLIHNQRVHEGHEEYTKREFRLWFAFVWPVSELSMRVR